MYSIQQKMLQDPQLRDRLSMVSLSFDPIYDTPEVISLYGSGFVDPSEELDAIKANALKNGSAAVPSLIYGNYDAVLMDDVGHFVMLERPDEFNRLLAEAVEELTGA